MKTVTTCAVNCPYLTIQNPEEEKLNIYCEKHEEQLMPTSDGLKLTRSSKCTITSVTWVFDFED